MKRGTRNRTAFFAFFLLAFAFSSFQAGAELLINEIMYDPVGDDNYNEWIELHNGGDEPIDLKDWKLCNSGLLPGYIDVSDKKTYQNTTLLLLPQQFAIITDGGSGTNVSSNYNVSADALMVHVKTSALCGGGLSIEGENITLTAPNGSVHATPYDGSIGKAPKSIERADNGDYLGSLVDGGTPGYKNSVAGFTSDASQLEITEFLPDPSDTDDTGKPLGEWVELYNPTPFFINAEGLMLYDASIENELYITKTNTLNGTVIAPQGFLVVYKDGDSDFSLNNNGFEELFLFDPKINKIIDNTSYQDSTEGMSWSLVNGNWYKTVPTPNAANNITLGCDYQLRLLPQQTIFADGSMVSWAVEVFRNYGDPANVSVAGIVEDSFGKVKETYTPWTQEKITTKQTKAYSPNLATDLYTLSFNITQIGCSDTKPENNAESILIAVNPQYKQNESVITISSVKAMPNPPKWGDQIEVSVQVYKGDETKNVLELYAADENNKRVSETTKITLPEKYTGNILTLPLLLDSNCGEKLNDGTYTIVLKGLDKEAKSAISIEGINEDYCEIVEKVVTVSGSGSSDAQQTAGKSVAFEIMSMPEIVAPGTAFSIGILVTGDEKPHEIRGWSYLYKGSKNYSAKDANKKTFSLQPGETKEVALLVKPNAEMPEGTYKMKVLLNKDSQKTNKELVQEIIVSSKAEESENVGFVVGNSPFDQKLLALGKVPTGGIVLYESSSLQARKSIPYFLAAAFGLLCVFLILKRFGVEM